MISPTYCLGVGMNSGQRRKSKLIKVGSVAVGGDSPISVQSMTKTDTRDVDTTVDEIKKLAFAGCEIIRLAVPDMAAAKALGEIVPQSPIPIIADIHFDHHLALSALSAGVHGLRINPGNLRDKVKVREVAQEAGRRQVPIRIGVNAGSLDPKLLEKHGGVTAEALAESALQEASLLEEEGFTDIKIAVKAFELTLMMDAVRKVARVCSYPLHLGVTESGLPEEGIVRSAIGIGALLLEGIGDTIRVSLTGDSVQEIECGIRILRAVGLRGGGPIVVSCPTCGRCRIPLVQIAREVAEKVRKIPHPLKIAVMGCAVNGPGEAKLAEYGIAGGKETGLIFRKGEILRRLPSEKLVEGLLEEIYNDLSKLPDSEND